MERSGERWLILILCLALAAPVWIVFAQTLQHDFVNYDDDAYVHLQPEIVRGLSLDGVKWAFTHTHSGNWHPLTSISHMIDCQLWQLNPRGHHLTSVLLHGASAILLFFALRDLTGRLWRTVFVAAVFAIHPLRVESVAWVSERKDILSGVFFMLTLLAYTRYARRPTWLRYGTMALLFVCGLMSKPMLVTLPGVLLLLDYWPLRRELPWKTLILEKVPLFLLSAGSAVITLMAQHHTIRPLELLPLSARAGNAFVSIVTYMGEMVWPTRLAVFYPLRDEIPIALAILSAVFIGAVMLLGLRTRRTQPYLAVGWLWYLGMLVPVLGLVQVGLQSHADRYTYLPQIGLALALTWLIADLSVSWKFRQTILATAATLVIFGLTAVASVQAAFWKNSETLWRHTLAVTTRNSVAHTNLGNVLPGREAIPQYEAALAIEPNSPLPLNNLAWILATAPDASLRDDARAVALAEKAKALTGDNDPAYLRTLAAAYANAGRYDEAIKTAERALPLAEAAGNAALAFDLRTNISGYRLEEPVRDTSSSDPSSAP